MSPLASESEAADFSTDIFVEPPIRKSVTKPVTDPRVPFGRKTITVDVVLPPPAALAKPNEVDDKSPLLRRLPPK